MKARLDAPYPSGDIPIDSKYKNAEKEESYMDRNGLWLYPDEMWAKGGGACGGDVAKSNGGGACAGVGVHVGPGTFSTGSFGTVGAGTGALALVVLEDAKFKRTASFVGTACL